MKRTLSLILFIGSFILNLNGQIIDSVLYHPYPNVDSIEYWHFNENGKVTQGYFLSCYCAIQPARTEKHIIKIIASEGVQLSINMWVWTYYNDVRKSCCSEFSLYPDSIITYLHHKRIKKIDHNAEYKFIFPDSLYAIPFIRDSGVRYEVKCDKSKCAVVINAKFIFKTFPLNDLEMELTLISQDVYAPEIKQLIQKSTKR